MLQSDPDSPVAMNKPGAPLFNKFLFLLVPAILLGTFGRPLLRPVLPILEQNWWASTIKPGHTCNNAPHSDIICKDALNKSNMANTVSASVAACLSIFLFPVMGKLSDTYGRRPLIVASSVMATVHPITLFLIDKNLLSFYFYYAGNLASVLAPGNVGFLAYIADTSAPENRAIAMGMVMGSLSISSCIAPFVSTSISDQTIYLVYLALAIVHFLYCLVFVPETLPADFQPTGPLSINPLKICSILNRFTLFRKLGCVVLLSFLVLSGTRDVNDSYTRSRFNFSKEDNAHVSEIFGFTGLLVQFVVLPLLARNLHPRRVLLVGICVQCASQFFHATANTKLFYFIITGVTTFGSITFPAVSSIKSINVDAHEQGAIQGALGGIQAFADVIGPLIFGGLFTWGNGMDFPQLPYFVGSGILLLATCIVYVLPRGLEAAASSTPMAQSINDASHYAVVDENPTYSALSNPLIES